MIAPDIDRKHAGALKFLAWAAFIAWIFSFVDGLSPQLQMLAFRGEIYLPRVVFKFIFLAAAAAAFALRRKRIQGTLFAAWSAFMAYLLFDGAYLLLVRHYPLEYILYGFGAYYLFIAVLPFLSSLCGLIEKKTIVATLIILFVPIAAIGLGQHFTNTSILPTTSITGYDWSYGAFYFHGHIRAFSLFGPWSLDAPLYAGILALLSAIVLIQKRGKSAAKSAWSALLLAALYSIYIIYLRTAYLMIGAAFLALGIRLYGDRLLKKSWFKLLPMAFCVSGVLLIAALAALGAGRKPSSLWSDQIKKEASLLSGSGFRPSALTTQWSSSESGAAKNFKYLQLTPIGAEKSLRLLAQESFLIRITEWRTFAPLGIRHIDTSLLGLGYIQNGRFPLLKSFCVDNFYLAIFLHIGLLGLLSVLWVLWECWSLICSQTASGLGTALLCLFSTLPLTGFFNIALPSYMLILVLWFLARTDHRGAEHLADIH